jgi:hypothetical protein
MKEPRQLDETDVLAPFPLYFTPEGKPAETTVTIPNPENKTELKTYTIDWDGKRLSMHEEGPWPRFWGCLTIIVGSALLWYGIIKIGRFLWTAIKNTFFLIILSVLPLKANISPSGPFQPVNDGGLHGTNCPGPQTPIPHLKETLNAKD